MDILYVIIIILVFLMVLVYCVGRLLKRRRDAKMTRELMQSFELAGISARVLGKDENRGYSGLQKWDRSIFTTIEISGKNIQYADLCYYKSRHDFVGEKSIHFRFSTNRQFDPIERRGAWLEVHSKKRGEIQPLEWKVGGEELADRLNSDVQLSESIIQTGFAAVHLSESIIQKFIAGLLNKYTPYPITIGWEKSITMARLDTMFFPINREQFEVLERIASHVKEIW